MEKLKKEIINKYGTVSEFCRRTGIARNSLEHFFSLERPYTMRQKALDMVIKNAIDDVKPIDYLVTEKDRDRLREVIIRDYDGKVSLFADLHNFDRTTLHQLINGQRKTKTDIVREILNAAEI